MTEKGLLERRVRLEEVVLPYFHGATAMGEPCFTRWDCEASARCDGLVPDSGLPGTCGPRPKEGAPCGTTEPYCPPDTSCTVLEDGSVCERSREENEFCRVFELGGRITDNCNVEDWCDDSIVTPACRPMLRQGDPCETDRQCVSFDCQPADATCGAVLDGWREERERDLRTWCPAMFPTATPWPEDEG